MTGDQFRAMTFSQFVRNLIKLEIELAVRRASRKLMH